MTATPRPARPRPLIPILVLVGIAIVGAVVGAYLDWRMWHPTSGLVVTIGAIGLLLIGALAWASQWQPIRPVAYGILAFAIGAILKFAVTTTVGGLNIQTVGVILMVAGIVAFLVSLFLLFAGRDRAHDVVVEERPVVRDRRY